MVNRSFSARLMVPLMPFQDVSAIALETLSQCGEEYEREHQNEVIERRQFGVDGDNRVNHAKPLPRPFSSRPRIGARLFVRGNARRFLLVRLLMNPRLKSVV